MKKIVIVLLALTALLALAMPDLIAPRVEESARSPGVVLVGAEFHCTGFVLKAGLVITAGHCMTEKKVGDLIPVLFFDRDVRLFSLTKSIYKSGAEDDVAALAGDTSGASPKFKTPVRPVKLGVPCFTVGYRMAAARQVRTYCVALGKSWDAFGPHAAGVVIPGNSGSPIWTMTGDLMGMVVRQNDVFPYFNYVSTARILEFLK